jgi:hypothetical protein
MGREIKRVDLDFSHPLDKAWPGYLPPPGLVTEEDYDWWYEHGKTEPPPGDGYQLWETVTEGSPISPVFATPDELAEWMASPAYTWHGSGLSKETYLNFINEGYAPSFMATPETGLISGVEWVGTHPRTDDQETE